MNPSFSFSTKVWRYPGHAAWHFVTLPAEVATEIREIIGTSTRGFGSIRVKVSVGSSAWNTSIFPDAKTKSLLLPVKKEVRKAENIHENNSLDVHLELIDLLI